MDTTGGLISLASGLITALTASGETDQQKYLKAALDKLYANEDKIGSMPFTKDELFNKIFPMIKDFYTSAADISAGRLGSEIGEGSANTGGGQNYSELYMQALAPIIAQGQEKSGDALQKLLEFYGSLDDAAKRRMLQLNQLEGQLATGLENVNPLQKAFLGFLQGANLGAGAYGNVSVADYFKDKAGNISDTSGGNK